MENKNMTKCKACSKEIAKGVKKCPHCGKDQRNFFMKHKIITGILVLIMFGVIGGMLGGGDEDKISSGGSKDASNIASTPVTKEKEKEIVQTEFKVGEIISYKDFDLVFENPRDIKSLMGSDTYLVLDVMIESKKDNFSFFGDIQGVTSDNEVVGNTIAFVKEELGDMISTAWTKTLNKGQKARGYVAFDKEIDTIEIRSSMFTNDVITIKLD